MADRHADILAQIQNVHQLEAVVTAMRGIAAARAQHGRALLPGIDAYSDVISAAIASAANRPDVGIENFLHSYMNRRSAIEEVVTVDKDRQQVNRVSRMVGVYQKQRGP